MEAHAGEHPRIGAVDVIPFVPLAATTLDDCVELARSFGQRIAARFDASRLPLRRGRLAARAGQAGRRPARPVRGPEGGDRPAAGASRTSGRRGCTRRPARSRSVPGRSSSRTTSTSIRADVELAKRIARRVRESGGGLPRVQANGFWIEELGRAPGVDEPARFRDDPALARVGHGPRPGGRGRRHPGRIRAHRAGPAGRLPRGRRPRRRTVRGAVERRLASAAAYLRLRDFSPMQALELRLEAARAGEPS